MQFLPVLVAATLAVFQTSPGAGRISPSDYVLVRSVTSGESIVVSNVGRVRLLGIDAPSREARDRLAALLANRWVRLEPDATSHRASTRRAVYVLTGDGTFVNAMLVREGLARVSTRLPLARLTELQRAEAEARAFRRGMWGGAQQVPLTRYTRRSKASRPPTSRPTTPSPQRRSTRAKKL